MLPYDAVAIATAVATVLLETGTPPSGVLTVGDLVLDVGGYDALVAGRGIDLSSLEFMLLHELALHRDMVVTREQLIRRLWPTAADPYGTLTAAVTRLRRKLAAQGLEEVVHTVRGRGYRVDSYRARLRPPSEPHGGGSRH